MGTFWEGSKITNFEGNQRKPGNRSQLGCALGIPQPQPGAMQPRPLGWGMGVGRILKETFFFFFNSTDDSNVMHSKG